VSTTLSKGWFLADSGRPCRRMVQTHGDESSRAPSDFRHPRERRAGLPSLRFPTTVLLRAGGRASRAVDDFPRLCRRLPSPARAEGTESRTSFLRRGLPKKQRRAPTRHRLEHLLVTDSVRGSMESAPARRTSRRHDRRFATREGHERCDRIEMLSVVHHSFARVRITPRHARVEPG
jgi:hypothetical protein